MKTRLIERKPDLFALVAHCRSLEKYALEPPEFIYELEEKQPGIWGWLKGWEHAGYSLKLIPEMVAECHGMGIEVVPAHKESPLAQENSRQWRERLIRSVAQHIEKKEHPHGTDTAGPAAG